jgi:hypothetical protein
VKAKGDSGHEVSAEEATVIARGITSAMKPIGGLEPCQVGLMGAIVGVLFDIQVDLDALDPLEPDELAVALSGRPEEFRRRVVHHMVLGELVLRPIPPDVARRVAAYAEAIDIDDQFVRIARRYAQGGFGLAWLDLQQSGFTEHWELARTDQLKTTVKLEHQLAAGVEDPPLAEAWANFQHHAPGTLGRGMWDMYRGRGFGLPGTTDGASAYLAQHDFVHVLADYGTNLKGELEVFSLIARADPDPKGFAWLATLVGLFETGYVADAGFFTGDLEEARLGSPAMHARVADALLRGRVVCDRLRTDLLEVDYHQLSNLPIDDVRKELGFEPKSQAARGSPGLFDLTGMSRNQQTFAASLEPSP